MQLLTLAGGLVAAALVAVAFFPWRPSDESEQLAVLPKNEVAELIKLLGDESLDKREAAEKALAAIGEPAMELLAKAARENPEADVKTRAQALVRSIGKSMLLQLQRFEGHNDEGPNQWPERIVVTADGKQAISTSKRFLRSWDLDSGKQILMFGEHNNYVYYGLAVSPDARLVMAGGIDGIVHLYDLQTGDELRSWDAQPGGVRGIAFLADGKQALTGGWDKSLHVWDTATGTEIRSFEGVREGLRCLAVSPDGKLAAGGHTKKKGPGPGLVRIWDVEKGKEILACQGLHKAEIMSVDFAPDGKSVLSAGFDQVMILWDVATGKELKRFEGLPARRDCAAFSPDGKRIIACGDADGKRAKVGTGTIRFWDVATGKMLYDSDDLGGGITHMSVLPVENRFLTASRDGVVRLWEYKW